MYAIECEKAGCEELCYYGATVCNSCEDGGLTWEVDG